MAPSAGLRNSVSRAPNIPGVYSFLDDQGNVLYIGKAKNLRNRLQGHLSNIGDARHNLLLHKAVSVEWTITRNEVEALILEAELIRIRKPPLNVQLRDSGRYPYIEITTDEKYPRLHITRERSNPQNRPRFGPYPDARNLRKLEEFLLDTCPLRRCSGSSPPELDRPCLMGQIGSCPAPCCSGISPGEYEERVDELLRILRGDWEWARKRIEEMMKAASRSLDYEEAGRLRDLLFRLNEFGWPAPAGISDLRSRDVVSVRDNWGVVMRIRGGRFTCVVRIPFDGRWKLSSMEERLSILLSSYYSQTQDIPGDIIVPEIPDSLDVISQWLSERRSGPVSISVPKRGERREVLMLAQRDLEHFLHRLTWKHPAGSRERVEAGLEALADIFSLPAPPAWIVCLDASNIQGSWSVAALVSFRDGFPDKSGYRRFSMPDEIGRNDPAMIKSAVGRYLDSIDDGEYPDIFLVDGGITQLRAAIQAAGHLSEKILFVSIAKREEILLDGRNESEIAIPVDSTPLSLLRGIRDEAHRFVLHYHQQKRSKGSLLSVLDEIPGIGRATRLRLLNHFGSVERVHAASLEEITRVPGIGIRRAMKVRDYLDTRETDR